MIPRPDRKLTDILRENRFTLSAEVIPPRNGASPASIFSQIEKLTTAGAQFLAVTKGAGGSLRGGSLPIAQAIKETFGTPCIAHFTCRDLLPEEVENQLIDHHFFGIRNILALRGDPPTGVAEWHPREGSFTYAYQLVEQIRALNEGRYLDRPGYSVESREKTDFCIGVACYPDHTDARERIDFFKRKVDAGAEFAISQMLFDPDSYERFAEECAQNKVSLPILPGTRLLKSRAQAQKMANRFQIPVSPWFMTQLPDTDAEAHPEKTLEAFFRLTDALKSKGAPGMHLFVLSDLELAERAIRALAPRIESLSPIAAATSWI